LSQQLTNNALWQSKSGFDFLKQKVDAES